MSANRDVGSAVLEAYSRILESRVSQVPNALPLPLLLPYPCP